MPQVVLVSMPFGNLFSPAMGLSLLKGGLNRIGVSCRVRYFGFDFAKRIGSRLYTNIADDIRPTSREMAGDWLFARSVFGAVSDDRAYVQNILMRRVWITDNKARPLSRRLVERLFEIRDGVDAFLDDCVAAISSDQPKIIGFTSVFQQHVAALALAKRLKKAMPEVFIVFGGANCEGVMGAETARQFPFIDAVISGEADFIFPEFVDRVLDLKPISGLEGVKTSHSVAEEFRTGQFGAVPSVLQMDDLAYPDFDDYFAEYSATGYSRYWQPRIFFETSRGCWWGAKQHCTFCGLNGSTMSFRSKSADRALEELQHLTKRHPGCKIQVVDNILDMQYFKDFLPELARRKLGVELFYETKSNLRKDQLHLMYAAGILEIQPGIESFGDQVLQIMRKGVTGLQNIQLLKWCKEIGIAGYWNVLWGFPGEPPSDYARMAELAPLLTHLRPPEYVGPVRLDRFSPNYFDAERMGIVGIRPLPAYHYIYPLPDDAVHNLAYHFTFSYRSPQNVEEYTRPLLTQIRAWKDQYAESELLLIDTGTHAIICDFRGGSSVQIMILDGIQRELYIACDGICGTLQQEEARLLAPLVERRLLIESGGRYLALAVHAGAYQPTAAVTRKFYRAVRALGRPTSSGAVIALARRADGVLEPVDSSCGRGLFLRSPSRITPSQFSVSARAELIINFRTNKQSRKGDLNGSQETDKESSSKEKEKDKKNNQEATSLLRNQ
ncbi:MAG: RiPP maturation radical SAM protein 1 [Acidobacteria bacterium]|nr:RiPP maturation radical SAM protein 1 [Acidobacteriota bacterium]